MSNNPGERTKVSSEIGQRFAAIGQRGHRSRALSVRREIDCNDPSSACKQWCNEGIEVSVCSFPSVYQENCRP